MSNLQCHFGHRFPSSPLANWHFPQSTGAHVKFGFQISTQLRKRSWASSICTQKCLPRNREWTLSMKTSDGSSSTVTSYVRLLIHCITIEIFIIFLYHSLMPTRKCDTKSEAADESPARKKAPDAPVTAPSALPSGKAAASSTAHAHQPPTSTCSDSTRD